MLFPLDPTRDIDFLKLDVALQTRDQKLPRAAAQKLKEILLDDQIKKEEFIAEFNKIISRTETLGWRTIIYLGDIKHRFIDEMSRVSWGQIGLIVFIFIILFYIKKKFKLTNKAKNKVKKYTKKISAISVNLLERVVSLFAYFVPLTIVYANYMMYLLAPFPYLHLIYPYFMQNAVNIYLQHPTMVNFGYFFTIVFVCVRLRYPRRSRFIRFHLVRGIMLMAFQSMPDSFFEVIRSSATLNTEERITSTFAVLGIHLWWLLPSLYQAITHTYPKSSFIRDAVEIQMGRDNDENFKWWDR